MTRGFYNIYPNQYIILIGPPGIGKGTAINPATALVKKAGTCNYLSDRITAEKILVKLEAGFVGTQQQGQQSAQQSQAQPFVFTYGDKTSTIISTELPVFLGTSDWMIPLLCEMWERNEFSYDTKNKGTVSAKGLCVSLFGGCVPDYIRNLSKDSTAFITSGFSSRCIFVFANDRGKPVSWPEPVSNFSKLEDDLVDDLKQISSLKGAFSFTKDARQVWDSFYISSLKPNEFESDVVSNFKARMVSHVVKLAMCLSVSEKDTLEITKDNLFNAIQFIDGIKKMLDIAFRSIGESQLALAQDKVLRFIEFKGITTRSEILKNLRRHITDEDLGRVLHVLEYSGEIVEETLVGKVWYRSLDNHKKSQQKVTAQGAGKP